MDSVTAMISEEEARSKILETVRPLPSGSRLGGRSIVSRRRIICALAVASFRQLSNGRLRRDRERSVRRPNGCASLASNRQVLIDTLRISAGEAVRIFTGAPIPSGADAVVMQEDVTRDGEEIVFNTDVDPGEFVRRRGCDLGEGQKILSAGERIRAATLALLASQGMADFGRWRSARCNYFEWR